MEVSAIAVEQPPKIEFGELALPIAFELAKRLKKRLRAIAQELQAELQGPGWGYVGRRSRARGI